MDKSLYDYCIEENRDDLLAQWHPTKNGAITPSSVAPCSHKKVWWCCGKGHEWQSLVKSRKDGANCPICTHKVIIPGENDFETLHPNLAKQWHPTKNNPLTPKDVFSGSLRKVWWKCEKGHEWETRLNSRSSGMGCPVCAGKVIIPGENDLGTLWPDIAAQWHPTKNDKLSPETVAEKANRKVWWECSLGHVYKTWVYQRAGKKKTGCPVCGGRYKEIMGEKE